MHPGTSDIGRRGVLGLFGVSALAFSGLGHVPIDQPEREPSLKDDGSATNPLITREIPSTREKLPVIGLGTWQTFDVGEKVEERAPLHEVLANFAALGGKVIDSSPMYGRAEAVVGDLVEKQGLRSKLFIATKVWTKGKEAGIKQMNDSMRRLRADPIDLLQVHNLVDVGTHLETLRAWKQEKRVRYIGVTHYTAASHDDVARIVEEETIDFIQINYSVGEREAEKRLLPLARDKGVAVIANRPFVSGNIFARLKGKTVPAWAVEIGCDSWAQLMLKFVVSHPGVTCTIPATSKVAHLKDNMRAGYGTLPDERMRARIAAAVLE